MLLYVLITMHLTIGLVWMVFGSAKLFHMLDGESPREIVNTRRGSGWLTLRVRPMTMWPTQVMPGY